VKEEQILQMVERFLSWRLPEDFAPDAGIYFRRPDSREPYAEHLWPVGTNLFTAQQAEAMIRHMLGQGEPVGER
jgi:hypothetical protein